MDVRDIHICLSAYACDPTRGSEPGIGWNIVREVARRHPVWAITRRKNQPAISAELARSPSPKLRMVYVDLPAWVLALKRGQLGIEVYYRLWQVAVRGIVRQLHRDVSFDLTQHITFGRYWGPTALADVPAPFVWGPVGGGETAPAAFLADFDARGRVYEFLRHSARRSGELSTSVRRAAHRAALGLAVTEETKDRLVALGTRRVELFSAMGFDLASYQQLCRLPPADDTAIRFVSIGRLLHWKGFHLGLKAFAAAALPRSQYWIVGEGPERDSLVRLARALRLEDRVRFFGALPRPDTLKVIGDCHVLIHPSLHDSGGWVCLEAMSAGRPVICLDLGGPAEQVTGLTGMKVAARHPGQAIEDLAHAMTELGRNAELRTTLGDAGRARVREEYLWERKGERLDELYASVLDRSLSATARS